MSGFSSPAAPGDRLPYRRPARRSAAPARSWSSTTSCAAAARTSRWAEANGTSRVVEGDIRDRDARPRARRGRRRRLPPGGDPHHAVRRGAAARDGGAGRRHVQRARGGRQAGVRKVVAASSASVYGLAEDFPTAEEHHPYANDTLYGAAKVFNEGLLRSFHAMHGLDYVALRYFNVYGPRMDMHGVYTEVLIRWMERIAAGQPPLIFGDGTADDGLRLTSTDIARANVLAAESDVTDAVFNIASGVETSLRELARHAAARDGLRPARRVRPGAQGQQRSRAASPTRRPRATARLRGRGVDLEDGLRRARRLVARAPRRRPLRAGRARAGGRSDAGPVRHARNSTVPRARPSRRSIESGWVSQGPKVQASRKPSPSGSAPPRGRHHELHDGAAARALRWRASGLATR